MLEYPVDFHHFKVKFILLIAIGWTVQKARPAMRFGKESNIRTELFKYRS